MVAEKYKNAIILRDYIKSLYNLKEIFEQEQIISGTNLQAVIKSPIDKKIIDLLNKEIEDSEKKLEQI